MCIKNLIDQLGYSGVRIGMKSDNAKELLIPVSSGTPARDCVRLSMGMTTPPLES